MESTYKASRGCRSKAHEQVLSPTPWLRALRCTLSDALLQATRLVLGLGSLAAEPEAGVRGSLREHSPAKTHEGLREASEERA